MKYFLIAGMATLLFSCSKPVDIVPPPATPPVPPAMEYTDLGNIPAGKGHTVVLDPDHDGAADIYFSYQLVGDGILNADKHQFYTSALRNIFFPFDIFEEAPSLAKGAAIGATSFPGYDWSNGSVILAEKVVPVRDMPYWMGQWKNTSHRYLPLLLKKGQEQYFGWIELSFNIQTELITLHRMAISRQNGSVAYAGY